MLNEALADAGGAFAPAGSLRKSTIEIIRNLSDLEALEQDWDALAGETASALVQFDWALAAARAFAEEELHIVVVREGGAVRAIAPLVLIKHGPMRVLEFLGHQLCEPQQLVGTDEAHLAALVRAIIALPYPLVLRKVPAGRPEIELFRSAPSFGLKVVAPSDSQDSRVALNHGDGGLESRMSSSRRSSLRRKLKLAERRGPVRFEFVHPSVAALPALLDEVFRVESSGWKGRASTGLQHDAQQGLFYRTLCERAAAKGALRLGFLRIGDETAAVRIDLICGGRSWELKIGYDERFGDCSPGLLLTHEMLKRGEADGLLSHDFLGDQEGWHESWPVERTGRATLRHYRASLSGGIALLRDMSARLKLARKPAA